MIIKITENYNTYKNFTSIEDIISELDKAEYNYYGFRNATEHDLEILDSGRTYLDASHEWIDNEDTEENLGGSCALHISDEMSPYKIKQRYDQCLNTYYGNTILFIADNNSEWGNDENEIILGSNGYGADVLGFVKL